MAKTKAIIDDGFNSEFVADAYFDGVLEIPKLERPKDIIIPDKVIPFSKHGRSVDHSEFLVFYEHDVLFGDVLRDPASFLPVIQRFPGMVTLDCSLYRDMPLTAQSANTYRNRAIGYYYQKRGVYVIPNIRWGDERSYTTEVLPDKFAFLGAPKHSIVSIGTYGCIKTHENKHYFKQGLAAMLGELQPEVVLVYGAMPDAIFLDFLNLTTFVNYPDWTSSKRKKV